MQSPLIYRSIALLLSLPPSASDSAQLVIPIWAAAQLVHIAFRRRALATLVFPTLSRKRACMLVTQSVRGQPLSGPKELNAVEPLWESAVSMEPRVMLGCSLSELLEAWGCNEITGTSGMVRTDSSGSRSETDDVRWTHIHPLAADHMRLFRNEEYFLSWRGNRAQVALREGAGTTAVLRALWQAAWLLREEGMSKGSGRQLEQLEKSLVALEAGFDEFLDEAQSLGWNTSVLNIKSGSVRVRVETEAN